MWSEHSDQPEEPRSDLRTAILVMFAVAVSGLLLGLLWWWISPKVPLISDGTAVFLKDSEGEQPIGSDGWFALLGCGLGALSAGVVFWRVRRGGVAVVIGLAVGSLLASLIGWRLGMRLGPSDDVVARAKQVGAAHVFDGPLKLQAKAALLAFPFGAMLTHLVLTAGFGPRDPQAGTGGDGGWGAHHGPTVTPDGPGAAASPVQPGPGGPAAATDPQATADPWGAPQDRGNPGQ